MKSLTRRLWAKQDQHIGDRHRLFAAVNAAFETQDVLYPGSYVDVAPSFVHDDVTYIDTDVRAARFFADTNGVNEIIGQHRRAKPESRWQFLHSDYTSDLALMPGRYDLLISLYAGFVSEHCTPYLRPGGLLLVNPSHGDTAMASIDPTYRLVGIIKSRSGDYAVSNDNLDTYLIPKRSAEITAESLHQSGRGIAYTKPAFAYLFEKQ